MTEAEWLVCYDPWPMLAFLRGKASDRKLRLFATASCRRVVPLMQHERLWEVTGVVERYADGQATYQDMVNAAKSSERIGWAGGRERVLANAAWCASAMNLWYWLRPSGRTRRIVRHLLAYDNQLSPHLAALLRELFGNPFQFVSPEKIRLTPAAVRLARGIYDERAFDRLPILGDALQDAGCDCDELLTHLRDTTSPHVRGCWALDLVLGKK